MKRLFTFLFITASFAQLNAQLLGIGTASPPGSAIVDVSTINKLILVPVVSSFQRTNLPSVANGLLVFVIDTGTFWLVVNISTFRKGY